MMKESMNQRNETVTGVRFVETAGDRRTNPHGKESVKEEQTILDLLRNRDPGGVEQLMEKYHSRLFSVAYGICKNHEDVEEVLQDAYMTAVSKIECFQERSRLFTWLYRITVNAALMKRRSNGRKLATVPLENPELFAAGDECAAGDYSPGWNQEEMVTYKQLRKKLSSRVEELPMKYRSVLALRSQGYSIRETSRILNTTPAAVKSRMHRGRLFLREGLDPDLLEFAAVEEGCGSVQ